MTASSPTDAGVAAHRTRLRFSPRRALPNGRAVIGALLVTIAAVGSFAVAAAGEGADTTDYLVVVADVLAGETLELDDVAFAPLVLSPEAATGALTTTTGLDGASALVDLHAGAILDARNLNGAAFVDGEPISDVHELTIPVPSERAPRLLARGDRVTVLAYTDADDVLHTAIEDALVLSFDPDGEGIGATGHGRLTLAIDEALDVAGVARWSYQALTVVLTTRALDDTYPDRLAPPTTTTTLPEFEVDP